jgi:hypothetical protein
MPQYCCKSTYTVAFFAILIGLLTLGIAASEPSAKSLPREP